jgi:hypothetical protein
MRLEQTFDGPRGATSFTSTAIVYDNDDDFTAVPKESPDYHKVSGLKGQRIFALTVKAARSISAFPAPEARASRLVWYSVNTAEAHSPGLGGAAITTSLRPRPLTQFQ